MKTRRIDKWKYVNYLKRSEELFETADLAYKNEKWNSFVINAIHAGISAADALCIFAKEIRYAGDDHREAVALFIEINPEDDDIRTASKQLIKLIKVKTDAEYGERIMNKKDADMARLAMERFVKFVEKRIKEMNQ